MRLERHQHGLEPREQPRVYAERRTVVREEALAQLAEGCAVDGHFREGGAHDGNRAVGDLRADRGQRQRRASFFGAQQIQRDREIGRRVEQGSVQVKQRGARPRLRAHAAPGRRKCAR